jgi:sec-independent protein translocase protein TatB
MIFNIGPLEFILIMLVAIIVLGPERMVSGARTFGRWIYKLVRSPTWRAIMTTSQEIRDLPNKIVRESGIEETMKEMQSVGTDLNDEISQAVKDVNAEVSNVASAVGAEVNAAVKDVNAELKQTAQQANRATAQASVEANQAIQPAAVETEPAPAAHVPDATPQTEPVAPTEVGGYDQAVVPVEQPAMPMQEISVAGPVAISNNGHSQESILESAVPPEASEASEVLQSPEPSEVAEAPKVRKVRKSSKVSKAAKTAEAAPPEEETSIQPPESPAAHIRIE